MSKIAEHDRLWKEEQERWGWKLPEVPRWKRLRGIRHVRWFCHNVRFSIWVGMCVRANLGICANPYDEWRLWAIYRGWA